MSNKLFKTHFTMFGTTCSASCKQSMSFQTLWISFFSARALQMTVFPPIRLL